MRADARISAGMEQDQPTPLVERLKQVSALWVAATGRSLGALATIVANHGSFFERLDSPGAGTTTPTLEKFARFFVEPDNWPDAQVPLEVARFAHAVGVSAQVGDLGVEIFCPRVPEEGAVKASAPSGRTPPAPCEGGQGASAVPVPAMIPPIPTGTGAADGTSSAEVRASHGEPNSSEGVQDHVG